MVPKQQPITYIIDSLSLVLRLRPRFYPAFGSEWTQIGPKFLVTDLREKIRLFTKLRFANDRSSLRFSRAAHSVIGRFQMKLSRTKAVRNRSALRRSAAPPRFWNYLAKFFSNFFTRSCPRFSSDTKLRYDLERCPAFAKIQLCRAVEVAG